MRRCTRSSSTSTNRQHLHAVEVSTRRLTGEKATFRQFPCNPIARPILLRSMSTVDSKMPKRSLGRIWQRTTSGLWNCARPGRRRGFAKVAIGVGKPGRLRRPVLLGRDHHDVVRAMVANRLRAFSPAAVDLWIHVDLVRGPVCMGDTQRRAAMLGPGLKAVTAGLRGVLTLIGAVVLFAAWRIHKPQAALPRSTSQP